MSLLYPSDFDFTPSEEALAARNDTEMYGSSEYLPNIMPRGIRIGINATSLPLSHRDPAWDPWIDQNKWLSEPRMKAQVTINTVITFHGGPPDNAVGRRTLQQEPSQAIARSVGEEVRFKNASAITEQRLVELVFNSLVETVGRVSRPPFSLPGMNTPDSETARLSRLAFEEQWKQYLHQSAAPDGDASQAKPPLHWFSLEEGAMQGVCLTKRPGDSVTATEQEIADALQAQAEEDEETLGDDSKKWRPRGLMRPQVTLVFTDSKQVHTPEGRSRIHELVTSHLAPHTGSYSDLNTGVTYWHN